jgi:lambda repressor-like predicted transcriptional regulator
MTQIIPTSDFNPAQDDGPKNIKPERLIYLLSMKKITLARIARDLGVKPPSVGDVVHGRKRSYKIQSHISGILGEPINRLWPETYTTNEAIPRGRRLS